jgi:hypothetical protein
MLITDSHGNLVSRDREDEAWAFKQDFQPDLMAHGGDWLELTALRSKASEDEKCVSIRDDFDDGVRLIRRFSPQLWLSGNHCDRLFKLREHRIAAFRDLGHVLCQQVLDIAKEIGARYVPYASRQDHPRVGAHLVLHGYGSGIHTLEAHRATYESPVIIGHVHSSLTLVPRSSNQTPSYSVGALMDFNKVAYDKNTLGGLKRSHGFLFGEYAEGISHFWNVSSRPGEELRPPSTIYRNAEHQSTYPG